MSPSTMLWEHGARQECAHNTGDKAEERIFNSV